MGKSDRKTYLKAIRTRYRRADKLKKCNILDEFCALCGYNRKICYSSTQSTDAAG